MGEGAVVRLVNAPGRWRGDSVTSPVRCLVLHVKDEICPRAMMARGGGVLPIVLWLV